MDKIFKEPCPPHWWDRETNECRICGAKDEPQPDIQEQELAKIARSNAVGMGLIGADEPQPKECEGCDGLGEIDLRDSSPRTVDFKTCEICKGTGEQPQPDQSRLLTDAAIRQQARYIPTNIVPEIDLKPLLTLQDTETASIKDARYKQAVKDDLEGKPLDLTEEEFELYASVQSAATIKSEASMEALVEEITSNISTLIMGLPRRDMTALRAYLSSLKANHTRVRIYLESCYDPTGVTRRYTETLKGTPTWQETTTNKPKDGKEEASEPHY